MTVHKQKFVLQRLRGKNVIEGIIMPPQTCNTKLARTLAMQYRSAVKPNTLTSPINTIQLPRRSDLVRDVSHAI